MKKEKTWNGITVTLAPPTKNHRPAIWECMLGTISAMNHDRDVKYFDYQYKAAFNYAGIIDWRGIQVEHDVRLAKVKDVYRWSVNGENPRKGQLVVWVLKK